MSWFKRKKRQGKTPQVEMLEKMSILTRFAKSGLLYVDTKEHKVVISATLATLFMGEQAKWVNFLGNLQMWFVYKASQMEWNKVFLKAEVDAVRKARRNHPMLTKLQENEIRAQARAGVDIEAVHLPKMEPYEFIISTGMDDDGGPRIIAVGRYDNGKFDMAPVEQVRDALE